MALSLSPALSLSSPCSYSQRPTSACHSRTSSESLLFTPPLSPNEEQLLAFLIPDIEPSDLAAYLSAPATPVLSDVSCLIGKSLPVHEDHHSNTLYPKAEAVYPSPVCAAAAATVVALDRLDTAFYPTLSSSPMEPEYLMDSLIQFKKKRCSTYAFMGSEDEYEERQESSDVSSSPVYVMSSRNTRKRLMLEQAFVSPDDDEDCSQSCYAQLFQGTSSDDIDLTSDLTSTLAFDLVLV